MGILFALYRIVASEGPNDIVVILCLTARLLGASR